MARAWYGSAPKGRWQEITQLMSAIESFCQLSLACTRLLSMLEGIYHPANAAEGEDPAISIKGSILPENGEQHEALGVFSAPSLRLFSPLFTQGQGCDGDVNWFSPGKL
jgi:hypothetical protein